MNKAGERLFNGLVKENPTFVLMLGMCPTLAVTTSAMNGLGMGLTTMVVLALSNLIISLLRADSGVYRYHCVLCDSGAAAFAGLYSGPEQIPGRVYSFDRGKLHYPGTGRKLCLFQSRHCVFIRRAWHGAWLYLCPDLHRGGAGAFGCR